MFVSIFSPVPEKDFLPTPSRSIILFALTLVFPLLYNGCSQSDDPSTPNPTVDQLETADFTIDSAPDLTSTLPAGETVTLSGNYTPEKAITEIQQQTGYKLALSNQDSQSGKSFTLKNVPFWEAVLTLRNKFNFYLKNLGKTLIFEEANGVLDYAGPGDYVRRAPASVKGSFLISRLHHIEPYTLSTVKQYVNRLHSQEKDRKHAHRILQKISGKSLPPTYYDWNRWMHEQDLASLPPLEIRDPGKIAIELWAESKHQFLPLFKPPEMTIQTSSGKKIEQFWMTRKADAHNKWKWIITPPQSTLRNQPLTVKGTFHLSAPRQQKTYKLQFPETYKHAEMLSRIHQKLLLFPPYFHWVPIHNTTETEKFHFTINDAVETLDGWMLSLQVKRQLDLSDSQRSKLQTISSKIYKRSQKDSLTTEEYDWYLEQLSKYYHSTPDLSLLSSKANQSEGQIIDQQHIDFSTSRYHVSFSHLPEGSPSFINTTLYTSISKIPVSFSLSPIYLFSGNYTNDQ